MDDLQDTQADELIIKGVPASPGIVLGNVYIHEKVRPVIESDHIEEHLIPDQIDLFDHAKQRLKKRWELLMEEEPNEESKSILEAQIAIITDPELSNQVEVYIKKERHSAQQAVNKAFTNYINILSESDSENMKNRMIDISDIRDRLIEFAGDRKPTENRKEGDILVSEEISPREVIQLSHQKVKGFVMEKGGHTSHAAIIARSMGIPAVVGAKGIVRQLGDEQLVCLNGESGLVTVNPSDETCERAKEVSVDQEKSLEEKIQLCKQPSETADGHSFTIQANVEFPEELHHVDQYCAEGIGLLRTESVYLDRQEFCNADNQINVYGEILENTGSKPVTIRLFDVGGDKFQGDEVTESNPFLGWRGIRMLLDERELLREQLKAILTISANFPGRVKILIPMVSSIKEIAQVKKEIKKCRTELADDGITAGATPLGLMVEIPSVAVQARYFAKEVDFFSIGTNDLTQYLLAVDRGNALISTLYDQQHPVLWKVMNNIIRAAREKKIEIEVCGELASYPVAAACLIGMGVSSLSMSPVSIPNVKKVLVQRSHKEMRMLAEQVLLCEELEEVQSLFNNWNNRG